jgi:hypothetical protein
MSLRLSARLAASRFASSRRGTDRRETHAWLPLALRWRRKRKQLGSVRTERSETPAAASVTSLAQFHLHFTTLASGRSRRDELRSLSPSAVIRELQRSVVSRHWMSVRATTLTMQTRGASRSPRLFAAGAAIPSVHASATAAVRPSRLPAALTIAARSERRVLMLFARSAAVAKFHASAIAAGRPARVAVALPNAARVDRRVLTHFEPARKTSRAGSSRNEHAQQSKRHAVIAPLELRVLHRHVSSPGAGVTGRSQKESTPSHVSAVRTSALVWRTAPRPQQDTAGEGAVANPSMSSSRSPVRSAAVQESAPEAPRRAARGTLQAADFDPALLDRLTDDVIRRVERRVRIERERRGL